MPSAMATAVYGGFSIISRAAVSKELARLSSCRAGGVSSVGGLAFGLSDCALEALLLSSIAHGTLSISTHQSVLDQSHQYPRRGGGW